MLFSLIYTLIMLLPTCKESPYQVFSMPHKGLPISEVGMMWPRVLELLQSTLLKDKSLCYNEKRFVEAMRVLPEARRCERVWPDAVSYVIKVLLPATKYLTQTENPGAAGMPICSA